MAKRFHQSVRVRNEGGMTFHEDMSAPALMPREVRNQYWPEASYGNNKMMPDLFEGVQRQMARDNSDYMGQMKPKKY